MFKMEIRVKYHEVRREKYRKDIWRGEWCNNSHSTKRIGEKYRVYFKHFMSCGDEVFYILDWDKI